MSSDKCLWCVNVNDVIILGDHPLVGDHPLIEDHPFIAWLLINIRGACGPPIRYTGHFPAL